MPVILLGLALLFGVSGTVVVSDNSKPGDVLFGIDRAVENIRLNFASEENKEKLKVKFAEERISELEEIIKKDSENSSDDFSSDDSVDDSEKDKNIEEGIGFALNLLGDINEGGELDNLVSRLNSLIDEVPEGTELNLKLSENGANFLKVQSDDSSSRFEIEVKETGGDKTVIKTRDGENKVKVEVKDGEVKVEVKSDNRGKGSMSSGSDDDSSHESDDSDDDDDDKDDDNSGSRSN